MTAEMFDPKRFSEIPLPDDTTLDVVQKFILNTDIAKTVKAHGKYNRLRVRHLYKNDKPCPLDMTLGEFRALAKNGLVHIVIDDGEGGTPAEIREPDPVI
jgi:hypothetical protein